MDGTYNWYDIPDVSTNTKVFTIDAPKEFRDINYNLVDYIHKQNGKGEGCSLQAIKPEGWAISAINNAPTSSAI